MSAQELDALFDAARRSTEAPEPVSPDLMARVLADALAHQPPPRAARASSPRPVWQGIAQTLGGWPGLGGLALATMAGLVFGLTAPPSLESDLSLASLGFGAAAEADLLLDPMAAFDVSLLLEETGS